MDVYVLHMQCYVLFKGPLELISPFSLPGSYLIPSPPAFLHKSALDATHPLSKRPSDSLLLLLPPKTLPRAIKNIFLNSHQPNPQVCSSLS